MPSNDFYAGWSDHYDVMTRREDRWEREHTILRAWQQRLGFTSALDAACGTGLHALILAELGVKTTAVDSSAAMLAIARAGAEHKNLPVNYVQSSMQALRMHLCDTFDVVFCLGNSLPHLLNKKDLRKTLGNFHDLLHPAGHLTLQLLNYARILPQRQRIVAIHRQGDDEFIRFYDFRSRMLQFNILHIDWSGEKPRHRLHSTLLFPYMRSELASELNRAGFREIQCYGDLHMRPFDENDSTDLIVTAEK